MISREYQTGFYNQCPKVHERESRLKQAAKITFALKHLASLGTPSAVCLDIGCSSGIMTAALTPLFEQTIGLDYDEIALRNIDPSDANVASFLRADAMCLPFADAAIDVVICAQVYEHVPDDETLVAEIYRVLKPGGIVFFSGPNKLFPIEPHYFIPFFHWLPRGLADACLRVLKGQSHYYERSRTLWGLRQLMKQFVVEDITIEILSKYAQFAIPPPGIRIFRAVPKGVWKLLLPFFPNFNWILRKPLALSS